MPYIIILTGHPCSGKTTLANKLRERALLVQSERIEKVVIVDEAAACPTRTIEQIATCYASSATEKVMRGALKSSFDRAVAAAVHAEKAHPLSSSSTPTSRKTTLIILDSTNYIKGFRYELFCICKAATSSYCVVWCLNDVNVVKEWNSKRRSESSDPINSYYNNEMLDAMILRYEPPDERNRWDKPLYRIDMRPQHIQSQQASEIAGQVLNQSVYNMHNLSEAISSNSENRNDGSDLPTATSGSTAVTSMESKGKVGTSLKRSAFQKKTSITATSTKRLPMPKTVPLTAEALSSLNTEMSSQSTTNAFLPTANNNIAIASTTTVLTNNYHSDNLLATAWTYHTVEDQIDALLSKLIGQVPPLKESTSTRQQQSVATDVLHIVDSMTQQLCTSIIDVLVFMATSRKNSTDTDRETRLVIPFRNQQWYMEYPIEQRQYLTDVELRRIRTEYIQWVAKNPMQEFESGNENVIIESFLAYIATQIRR
jgi:tRNA uridine 5-carbamoylmethylation protein Kti12